MTKTDRLGAAGRRGEPGDPARQTWRRLRAGANGQVGTRRWTRSRLVAGVVVAMLASIMVTVAPPAGAEEVPVAAFDYSMPDRFGLDRNNDGLVDYPHGTTEHDDGYTYNIVMESWRVDLDACASTAPDGSSFTWRVIDQPDPNDPIVVEGGPACDDFFMNVPEEGAYRVELIVAAAGAESTPVLLDVVVQDWLIVAVGDSYGAGEGVPERTVADNFPGALAKANAAWADVEGLEVDNQTVAELQALRSESVTRGCAGDPAEADEDRCAELTLLLIPLKTAEVIGTAAVLTVEAGLASVAGSVDTSELLALLTQFDDQVAEAQVACGFTAAVPDPGPCGALVLAIAWTTGALVAEATDVGIEVVLLAIGAATTLLADLLHSAVQFAQVLTAGLKPTWQDEPCHRSARAGAAQAAARLEAADPRTSVTFVHLACSGATAAYGVTGWYSGAEPKVNSEPHPDGLSDVECDQPDPIEDRHPDCIPPQVTVAAELVGDREVDGVHLSIGGNDAHFGGIIMACIVQEPCSETPNAISDPDSLCPAPYLTVPGVVFAVPQPNLVGQLCHEYLSKLPPGDLTAEELWEQGKAGEDEDDGAVLRHPGLLAVFEGVHEALVGPGDLLPASDAGRIYQVDYGASVRDGAGALCDFYSTHGFDALPGVSATESAYVDGTIIPELSGFISDNPVRHGWTFVPGVLESFEDHGYCADDNFTIRMQESFVTQGDETGSVHPNDRGYGGYADALLAAWNRDLYPTGSLAVPRRPDQAPFADAGGPWVVEEGSAVTLANDSRDSDGDPVTYEWTTDVGDAASIGGEDTPVPVLQGIDDATGDITVTAADEDGARGDTASLTVRNVAPTVDVGTLAPVVEGRALTGAATFTDPGVLDTFTAVVDYGDETITEPFVVDGGTTPLDHVYLDEGDYSVTVTVTDDDGGIGTSSAMVSVTNAPPEIGVVTAPVDPVLLGSAITASAPFTDPGILDVHTGTWDWGDGTTSAATITEANGSGTVTDIHAYATTGIFTVTLTIDDGDDGQDTAVHQYVVVFDPEGGFATGGGFFESPAGAYPAEPAASGKAVFAFVSKYLRGANAPTGSTSFRFAAADFDFVSTSYEWLVIAGARAQYKGWGEVNGQDGYRFILAAVDGDHYGRDVADRLRVKIWDDATGTVVYDNQLGDADDALADTVIGGGSISVKGPR